MIIRLLVFLSALAATAVWGAPYNGWGPGEDYGHTGTKPPRKNPNAIYGYDYHDVFDEVTGYGATYNLYKSRPYLFDKSSQVYNAQDREAITFIASTLKLLSVPAKKVETQIVGVNVRARQAPPPPRKARRGKSFNSLFNLANIFGSEF